MLKSCANGRRRSLHSVNMERALVPAGFKAKIIAIFTTQANGRTERMVQTVKQAIGKMVEGEVGRWEEKIATMETTYQERKGSHGYSHLLLMCGVECCTEYVANLF